MRIASNLVNAKTTIKLDENNEMIDDNIESSKLFNKHFVNIVEKLGLFTKERKSSFHRN